MARKGGRKGGSSAARSAAAKKGWETRRRGGAKSKPAATKRTAASKAKPTAKRGGMPRTTSARGRALTNQRRAADLVRASRAGKGPSAKAVRSVLTAQRARAFYAATGGGKKRSAVKAKSAAKVGKSIRAESRAKATAARAKVAGRPRSRVVAKPAAQRPAAMPRSRVLPAGQRRQAVMRSLPGQARLRMNEARTFGYFMRRAQIPTTSTNWGSQRGQGKRLGGGMVRGAMSAGLKGTRNYLDYSKARGLSPTARREIRIMPDEYKKVVIGAMQKGWKTSRALRLAYRML